MSITSFAVVALFTLNLAGSNEPLAEESSGIEYASPQAAEEALRARPEVEMREENGWLVFTDTPQRAFWSIAMRGNPAYPAVVKRVLVERDGAINMEMSVKCGASKSVCDEMVRAFQANTDEIRKQFDDQEKCSGDYCGK